MNSTNLNIRTDKNVKAAAEKIFEALGLNMTTAVNMFLRQTIRENGIPFELKLDVPNDVTREAMEEASEMMRSPEKYKKYSDVDSMMEDILGEV